MIKKSLGKRINSIRRQKELSQYDLSVISGVSHSYINRLLNGSRTNISIDKLRLLSESLEVSIIDLILDTNEELEISSILKRTNLRFQGKGIDNEMLELIEVLLKKGIYCLDDSLLDYESELPVRVTIESF